MSLVNRSGVSVSIWIWITGGLILAALTIVMAVTTIGPTTCQISKQQAIDQFNGLNSDAEILCRNAPGTRKSRTVTVGCGVKAIFASDLKGEPPGKAPKYISEGRMSKGENICLTFNNQHYGCTSHACDINMTYVGTPAPGSDMYQIGRQDGTFEFDVTLKREVNSTVVIRAEHRP